MRRSIEQLSFAAKTWVVVQRWLIKLKMHLWSCRAQEFCWGLCAPTIDFLLSTPILFSNVRLISEFNSHLASRILTFLGSFPSYKRKEEYTVPKYILWKLEDVAGLSKEWDIDNNRCSEAVLGDDAAQITAKEHARRCWAPSPALVAIWDGHSTAALQHRREHRGSWLCVWQPWFPVQHSRQQIHPFSFVTGVSHSTKKFIYPEKKHTCWYCWLFTTSVLLKWLHYHQLLMWSSNWKLPSYFCLSSARIGRQKVTAYSPL